MKEKRNRTEIVERCVELWEASVRATHDFLVEGDIDFYRPFVRENCEKLPLLLHYEGDDIVAFLGYDMTSIEMLFVDPDYRGRGIGRDLIEWAIEDVHAERVAVNEQNVQAVGFYARMGFEVEHRTETLPDFVLAFEKFSTANGKGDGGQEDLSSSSIGCRPL